jgi:hypothetical protein
MLYSLWANHVLTEKRESREPTLKKPKHNHITIEKRVMDFEVLAGGSDMVSESSV